MSEALRKEGNKLFADAFPCQGEAKFSPGLRISRAEEAIKLYNECRNLATQEKNGSAWLSATKNYCITSLRLASMKAYQERETKDMILFRFKDAVLYGTEALANCEKVFMGSGWKEGIEEKLFETVNSCLEYAINSSSNWRDRTTVLFQLLQKMEAYLLGSAKIYVEMANECLKAAIISDEKDYWKDSLYILQEMDQWLSFARQKFDQVTSQNELFLDLNSRFEDIYSSWESYMCRAKSAQLRNLACDMMHELLFDEEDLNIELAWLVVDNFTHAMKASKSSTSGVTCCESEARAAMSLGLFYHKVLKLPAKGHEYLMQAVQLVDSITHSSGSTFFHCTWYQDGKKKIEEYREALYAINQEKLAKERAPTLAKLKPQLDAMKASYDSITGKAYKCHAFLIYIYEKHPPKTGKALDSLDKNDDKALKKAALLAIREYHTDKAHNKKDGMDWYILCEEIVKTLNNFYDYFKAFESDDT